MNRTRKNEGSIAFWLIMIAVIGLTIVLGLVSLELLIRWVSLSRVQNAANEAALVYSRDMIRLRDQALSELNTSSVEFSSAGIPYDCSSGCTPTTGAMSQIPGASSLEYTNASQALLYNIWGERLSDPSQVDNVNQFQCYRPHNESRFNKISSSPLNTCRSLGNVTSPIMSLEWSFQANPYGTGVCCSAGAPNDGDKDFCVDVTVKGRMDPIIAGGLPFLTGEGVFSDSATSNNRETFRPVRFITVGDFEIHARAIAYKMDVATNNGDTEGIASNLSAETISLENIDTVSNCGAAPQFNPLTNPISPPNPSALSVEWNLELPEDKSVEIINPPDIPPPPLIKDCPESYKLSTTIVETDKRLEYICIPPQDPDEFLPSCHKIAELTKGNYHFELNYITGDIEITNKKDKTKDVIDISAYGDNAEKIFASKTGLSLDLSGSISGNDLTFFTGGSTLSVYKLPRKDDDVPFATLAEGDITNQRNSCTVNEECEEMQRKLDEATLVTTHHTDGDTIYADVVTTADDVKEEAACMMDCGCFCERGSGECAENFGFNSPIIISFDRTFNPIEKYTKFSFNGIQSQKTPWITFNKKSGFLAYDFNKNGDIDNGTELFGTYTNKMNFTNGYAALAKIKDNDNNGVIENSELEGLLFWSDTNSDGKSSPSELAAIRELGINKIQVHRRSLEYKEKKITENTYAYPISTNGVSVKNNKESKEINSFDIWFKELKD